MTLTASKTASDTVSKIRLNKHNGVYVILAVLLVIAGFYSPNFIQPNNLMTMLRQASALGIMTIGQLFVFIGGGVDLSVAATLQMGITIFMYGYNNFGMPGFRRSDRLRYKLH